MNFNEIVKDVHGQAVKAGWWDGIGLKCRTPLEIHMLIVTEVAEASEHVRKGMPSVFWKTPEGIVNQNDAGGAFSLKRGEELLKPDGELIEMADIVIRVMDWCGRNGWDLEKAILAKHEYNKTRAFRHGGKKY